MANSLTKVNSGGIKDDSIVNADIKSDAAIALSKLASTPAVLTGSTNNTICTVTGANAIQGEGNLTFDGNNLAQTIDAGGEGVKLTAAGDHYVAFVGDSNRTNDSVYCTSFSGKWNGTTIGSFNIITGADDTAKDEGELQFTTTPSGGSETERLRINSSGHVIIKNTGVTASTGLLQLNHTDGRKNTIGTHYAGNAYDSRIEFGISDGSTGGGTNRVASISYAGISFGSDTASANRLDDYEEGEWTPTLNANLTINSSYNTWSYTKIGRQVTIRGLFICSSVSGTNPITVGLPFASANLTQLANAAGVCNMFRRINHTAAGLASYIPDNSSTMEFYGLGEGTDDWTRITNDDIDTATEVYISHTYFTA